jgi:hypothetical protein
MLSVRCFLTPWLHVSVVEKMFKYYRSQPVMWGISETNDDMGTGLTLIFRRLDVIMTDLYLWFNFHILILVWASLLLGYILCNKGIFIWFPAGAKDFPLPYNIQISFDTRLSSCSADISIRWPEWEAESPPVACNYLSISHLLILKW